MFNFPFFGFPYSNYYPYYNKYIHNDNDIVSNIQDSNANEKNEEKVKSEYKEGKKRSYKYNSFGPISFINPFDESFNEHEPVLEILGLKLYLDDLIILVLLFLLYSEDVDDDILFLVLILLLLN